jgi:hypothetical protein
MRNDLAGLLSFLDLDDFQAPGGGRARPPSSPFNPRGVGGGKAVGRLLLLPMITGMTITAGALLNVEAIDLVSENEELGNQVTGIDNDNIRLTMGIGRSELGENVTVWFELTNGSSENIWIVPRPFYFLVYDENHALVGRWPSSYHLLVEAVMRVGPGESYAENLCWDLKIYPLQYLFLGWHKPVDLDPGTYYLEGHAGYLKLTTPLLEITILEPPD